MMTDDDNYDDECTVTDKKQQWICNKTMTFPYKTKHKFNYVTVNYLTSLLVKHLGVHILYFLKILVLFLISLSAMLYIATYLHISGMHAWNKFLNTVIR